MALFKEKKEASSGKRESGSVSGKSLHSATLVRPRITEKASGEAENNVYVFEIADGATKKEVAKAVSLFYKVIPEKIRISRLPKKNVLVRGREGTKAGVKKAHVYLKEGDKIEFV